MLSLKKWLSGSIRIVVLLKLVISDYISGASIGFIQVRRVSSVILSSFGPECRIRIRGVLRHGRTHSAICLFPEPMCIVFNDSLFRETSDKKLVFGDAVKILTAFAQQLIGITKDFLNLFSRVIVMLEPSNQIIMQVDHQFGNTGIQQFSTAQVTDICLNHHGIHPSYPWTDSHHPDNPFPKVRNAVMKEIDVMECFVIVAALTES